MGTVVSPETVRAMSTARLFRMLAVFVTLVSVLLLATLSLGVVSVSSTQTVLASRRHQNTAYISFFNYSGTILRHVFVRMDSAEKLAGSVMRMMTATNLASVTV